MRQRRRTSCANRFEAGSGPRTGARSARTAAPHRVKHSGPGLDSVVPLDDGVTKPATGAVCVPATWSTKRSSTSFATPRRDVYRRRARDGRTSEEPRDVSVEELALG